MTKFVDPLSSNNMLRLGKGVCRGGTSAESATLTTNYTFSVSVFCGLLLRSVISTL